VKLARPGFGPAAELPRSSQAWRRHGGCSSSVVAPQLLAGNRRAALASARRTGRAAYTKDVSRELAGHNDRGRSLHVVNGGRVATTVSYHEAMPQQLAPRKLFVQIVESPSPDDIFDGHTEGRVLTEALRIAEVSPVYNLVVNIRKFADALLQFVSRRAASPDSVPILHMSMHGNERGVQLTDGTFLDWEQLRSFIYPSSEGKALICMSSCFGYYGSSMAMSEESELPFLGLIGHAGAVSWSTAAVGYVSFYHRLSAGASITDAIEAMKQATGDRDFGGMSASHARNLFKEQIDRAKSDYLRSLIGGAVERYLANEGRVPDAG
jgi:hypothetical protein